MINLKDSIECNRLDDKQLNYIFELTYIKRTMMQKYKNNRFSFISGPILTHKTRWDAAGFMRFVRLIGLEPTQPELPDPKSGASTNFATGAWFAFSSDRVRLGKTNNTRFPLSLRYHCGCKGSNFLVNSSNR